jgi:hypothetical protein
MAMSNFLQNRLLDAALNNTAYTGPANVYVALSTVDLTGNTAPTELVGNGYSRGTVEFSTAANGAVASSNTVSFTATGNTWPTVRSVALMDADTGGNVLVFFNIPPRVVEPDDSLQIPAGDIQVALV